MGLILSLNNSIQSFNTGKFVLDQYTGAAAAYSLRRLSVNTTNVVRVRRSVDNAEDDFTADEVADGTMLNWVNADMPLPLDTATAAAAYSLRNLKTSYTGSVIRVRRSSDNAEADFTADEITDGTMTAWVNEEVEKVLNGDFSNGSTNWIVSNGSVTGGEYVSGALSAYQTGIKQVPFTYTGTGTLTFDLTLNSGSLRVDDGGSLKLFTNSGSQSITLTNPSKLEFNAYNLGFDGIIDNISFIPTNVDGYVTTWYDQAGSNDATQGTAANQPKIVDAGVLVEENGKPAVDFDGIADAMQTGSLAIAQPYTIFNVVKSDITGAVNHVYSTSTTATSLIFINTDVIRIDAGVYLNSAINQRDTNQTVLSNFYNGATSSIYKDGTSIASGNAGTNTLNNLRIGAPSFASQLFDGKQQELIIYPSDQSSNRTTIETNINDYYNIYAQDRDGFVTTWYDQSGNGNNAVQANAANQPKIVNAGSLITSNGYQVIQYDGTDDNLTTSLTATGTMLMGGSDGSAFYEIDINGSYSFLPSASNTDHPLRESIRVIWSSSLTTAQKTAIESLITYTDWDFSDVTNFTQYWRARTELTDFPLINTSNGTNFVRTWEECSSLTSFPLLNVSSGTNFGAAWRVCTSLQDFPANMFDSVTAKNFTLAFDNTNLSSQSIENIVVSIDTAGQSSGTLTITGGGNATTATAQTAVDNLRGRGWTVTVPDGY